MEHLPHINIYIIPHKSQSYETLGNYTEVDEDCWDFEISKTNADYEFLVTVHELVEWYLTQKHGINEKSISAFDKSFERKRKQGNTDEPGHDPKAPYHKEHVFAEKIEKLIAKELKIKWSKYDKELNNL